MKYNVFCLKFSVFFYKKIKQSDSWLTFFAENPLKHQVLEHWKLLAIPMGMLP